MTMVVEWTSGRAAYPHDDVEILAGIVLTYLTTYGHSNPKSKEEITTAVGGRHENVSLIVDALIEQNLAREVDSEKGQYIPVDQSKEYADQAIETLATNNRLRFYWKGFDCRYSISYSYITPADYKIAKRLVIVAYLGVALGAAGIILTIVLWLFN
jgi:hypothetical protein